MQTFSQFREASLMEAVDADFDMNEYGAWLNVKTGKVVHVKQMGHASKAAVAQLNLPKDFDLKHIVDYEDLGPILHKTPWVRIVFPSSRAFKLHYATKEWWLNYGKQNNKNILKWMKGWLEDADVVIADEEEDEEGKRKPFAQQKINLKDDPLGGKRKLVKALGSG